MRTMLIGWDPTGRVVRATHEMVVEGPDGVVGFADFEAHEKAGGSLTDYIVYGAVAVDVLPALPHHLFPPEPVSSEDPPTRTAFLMSDRLTYRNIGGVWTQVPPRVIGAGSWPEFLGESALEFDVDLRPGLGGGSPRVRALVHRGSRHRRVRADLDAEVQRRVVARAAEPVGEDGTRAPVDVGDLFGGPGRPLILDSDGRTRSMVEIDVPVRRPRLPVAQETQRVDR